MFLDDSKIPAFCREIGACFDSGGRMIVLEADGDLVPDHSDGVFYFRLATDAQATATWLSKRSYELIVVMSPADMRFGNDGSEKVARELLTGTQAAEADDDEYSRMAAEMLKPANGFFIPEDPVEKVAMASKMLRKAKCPRALIVEDADVFFPPQENDKKLLGCLRTWQSLAAIDDRVAVILLTQDASLLHASIARCKDVVSVTKPPPSRQDYYDLLITARAICGSAFNGHSADELAGEALARRLPYRGLWNLVQQCVASETTLAPDIIAQVKPLRQDKADFMAVERPSTRLSDVAGLEEVKTEIGRRVLFPLRSPEEALKLGAKLGGGMVIYGAPGTGKTLIARALAGELNAPFFSVTAADILSKWYGEAERKTRRLFTAVRRAAKESGLAVLFIDEVDSLLVDRDSSDNAATRRLVTQFLAEIEGFDTDRGNLLLIFATNKPWALDAALRRGRIDTKIHVPLPDKASRREIWRLNLHRRAHRSIGLDVLAERSEGMSGADIAGLCEDAAAAVLEESVSGHRAARIEMSDLTSVLRHARPSVSPEVIAQYIAYASSGKDPRMHK